MKNKNIVIFLFFISLVVFNSCKNDKAKNNDSVDAIEDTKIVSIDTLFIEDLISQWILIDDTTVIENMMEFTEDNCIAIFDQDIQMRRKIGGYYLDSNYINVEFNKTIVENTSVHYQYYFNIDTLVLTVDSVIYKYIQTNFDYPITERIYDRIYDEVNGFRMVFIGEDWASVDGRMGFINTQGQEVIPVEYELVYDFEYNEAVVVKNGEQFVIDTLGNIIRTE